MKVINLDKEIFEQACSLCEVEFTEGQIIEVLKNGTDVEKQIAILKIDSVSSEELVQMLVAHLTGQDGPIREVSAIKLNEVLKYKNCASFDDEKFYSVYVNAVCDVNPNVSRTVIDFLTVLKNQVTLLSILIKKIENIYSRIENPDIEQKNFLTVRLFNLYWCLEAVGELFSLNIISCDKSKLGSLLEKALMFNNYTIDEKVAKIISLIGVDNFNKEIINKLKNSDNFYVRRYFEG